MKSGPKPQPIIERLGRFTEPEPMSGCWLWTGAIINSGYGVISIAQRNHLVHRVAYQLNRGEIPRGYEVDHQCLVRVCVNPAHLEAVTPRENMRRTPAATKPVCINGHPYGPNVYRMPRTGRRKCRICHRERMAQARREGKRWALWQTYASSSMASRNRPQHRKISKP